MTGSRLAPGAVPPIVLAHIAGRAPAQVVAREQPERVPEVERLLPKRASTTRGPRGAARDVVDLPSESAQARRFERARAARSAAMFEDYAELIDDLLRTSGEARATDIAKRLGVSHPTVVKTIGRLKREGLAESRPYRGVFLTPAGAALARRVRDRHHLVVAVLLALGVPADAAEADAEGIEHHVSEVTLKAFSTYLAKVRTS